MSVLGSDLPPATQHPGRICSEKFSPLLANTRGGFSAAPGEFIGDRAAADTQALLRALHSQPAQNLVLQIVADTSHLPATHLASAKTRIGGKATAYVCRQQTCSAPVVEPGDLALALSRRGDLG